LKDYNDAKLMHELLDKAASGIVQTSCVHRISFSLDIVCRTFQGHIWALISICRI